jgi:hypothetical protein
VAGQIDEQERPPPRQVRRPQQPGLLVAAEAVDGHHRRADAVAA